ncbi:hypothetical protein KCU90_g247, partial [Aureobasidium melanogenum]
MWSFWPCESTDIDKVLESLAEIALELWRRVLWNEEKDFHGMNVGIWRPDVGLVVISRLLDDFWSHPERGSNECVLLGHGGRELARNTKIGKLDLSVRAKQDICSFNVSVKLVVIVQVFQAHEQLSDDDDNLPPEQYSMMIHRSEPLREDRDLLYDIRRLDREDATHPFLGSSCLVYSVSGSTAPPPNADAISRSCVLVVQTAWCCCPTVLSDDTAGSALVPISQSRLAI